MRSTRNKVRIHHLQWGRFMARVLFTAVLALAVSKTAVAVRLHTQVVAITGDPTPFIRLLFGFWPTSIERHWPIAVSGIP